MAKTTYEFAVKIVGPWGRLSGEMVYHRDDPPEVSETDALRVSRDQVEKTALKVLDILGGVASDGVEVVPLRKIVELEP